MKSFFSKPLIFISYSREDEALATFIFKELKKEGYDVFIDFEQILIGEQFVDKISQKIKKCDGMVFILSKNSATSDWCQAEVLQAMVLEKILFPIRIGKEKIELPVTLEKLQTSINYILINTEKDYQKAGKQIIKRIEVVKRSVYRRWIRNSLLIVVILSSLFFLYNQVIEQVNKFFTAEKRKEQIETLKTAKKIYNQAEIDNLTNLFKEDELFLEKLYPLQINQNLSSIQHLNIQLLETSLNQPKNIPRRVFIEDFNWSKGQLSHSKLNELTFIKGDMDKIQFDGVSFNGVVWSGDFMNNDTGLRISNTKFDFCRFNGGQFLEVSAVQLDFKDCIFRGTEIDIQGFGAVHFFSSPIDTASSVITNEVAVFENCSILNCVDAPSPNVIEILNPDSEVQFTNVVFVGCHFRGFIRPSWFKDCFFTNCIFPTDFSLKELEFKNTSIDNCLLSDEECY